MIPDELDSAQDHREIKEFYESEYYGPSVGHGTLPWHMRIVAGRLGDLRNKEVLDVACGTGTWLVELASRGAKVAGIDIATRALEACQSRLPEAELHEGIAESLPFETGRFDLVTCLGSLEHFLDQPKALREMRRVAKPSAQFLILVPNAGFLTRRLGLFKGTDQVAVRETVRPIPEWLELLDDAGLSVTDTWRDLHILSRTWITRGPFWHWPVRLAQAVALAIWPLGWQYQIYFFGSTTAMRTNASI